ncbi:MAG: aminotransferase class I/II-fold pyridoxal phosphate-dependent enzyme [Spirochaetota bacterium]
MNKLAQELNEILEDTCISKLLSDFGKRIYFPKGIVAQSAEAKKHAHRYNATIGMAYAGGEPIELSAVRKLLPDLSPSEAVSYSSTAGDEELRTLWKNEILKKNPGIKNPAGISLPAVVPGLTNGIAQLADLFADPGDCVVIPDMFWGNYRLIFEERRCAQIASFPFFNEKGGLNITGFKETMKKNAVHGKVILLVNFPNNPTGYSPTVREANELINAIKELAESGLSILVITDDAYFGLFYEEDTYKQSLFSSLSSIHSNVLAAKVDGTTKEDFSWGFRIGFLTFGSKSLEQKHYEAFNKKLMGAIRSSVSNSSKPAQSLIIKAMQTPGYEEEKQKYFEVLQSRYKKVKKILATRSTGLSLKALPFNSGYFMAFLYDGGNAEDLRKELLMKDGIGTISIQDKYLRVAFASIDLEDMEGLYAGIFLSADKLAP